MGSPAVLAPALSVVWAGMTAFTVEDPVVLVDLTVVVVDVVVLIAFLVLVEVVSVVGVVVAVEVVMDVDVVVVVDVVSAFESETKRITPTPTNIMLVTQL